MATSLLKHLRVLKVHLNLCCHAEDSIGVNEKQMKHENTDIWYKGIKPRTAQVPRQMQKQEMRDSLTAGEGVEAWRVLAFVT